MKLSGPFFRVNRSLPRPACLPRALRGAILGTFALLACSGEGGPTAIDIPIDRIEITGPCTSLVEGDTCRIGVAAFTVDGRQISNPVLRFLTDNSFVATVDSSGLVRGIAPGSATISVTNSTDSRQDTFRVFVFPRSDPK